jgi:hypothetical protein
MHRVVEFCEQTNVPFRTVPRLQDVVAGRMSFNELKEVAIEDLLGREAVQLDWTAIRTGLSGKRVFITGGGGSIGSELCRQVARLGVESLTILDYPSSTWSHRAGTAPRIPGIDRQRDARRLRRCGGNRARLLVARPRSSSTPPRSTRALAAIAVARGVPNNVVGTQVVAQAADRHGVTVFVRSPPTRRSTDQRDGRLQTRCGNLLPELSARSTMRFHHGCVRQRVDLAGSVVPLFREQIRAGGRSR